jgi:DNA invertase Pin-like site-specific DNA recombinase
MSRTETKRRTEPMSREAKPTRRRKQRGAKAVACYLRVSTSSQNEAAQRAEITKWLKGSGIDLGSVRWYVDKGRSGDTLERPAFARLQAAVFAGEVGTVAVYKLDRLSRKLREGLDVLCDWCERGLRVVSVTQQIDFNGSLGKMLAAVLLGIAQMEQETRRERQAAGIAVAKRAGKYRGRKPGTTKADPRRARQLRERGLSVPEIAKALGVGRNTVFVYLRQAMAV